MSTHITTEPIEIRLDIALRTEQNRVVPFRYAPKTDVTVHELAQLTLLLAVATRICPKPETTRDFISVHGLERHFDQVY